MRKFYICTTGIAKGPFDVSEIEALEINSHDLIWTKHYYDTRKAIQVPEFKEYFKTKLANGKKLQRKIPVYQRIGIALLLSVLLGVGIYYYSIM